MDARQRKKVRQPMPAADMMSSTVVQSNPRRANNSKPRPSSAAREVTLGRPALAGPDETWARRFAGLPVGTGGPVCSRRGRGTIISLAAAEADPLL